MNNQPLAQEIHKLVADLPDELVNTLAHTLNHASATDWQQLKLRLIDAVTQPAVRHRLQAFLDFWYDHYPAVSAEAMSLAVLTAAEVAGHYREAQHLELVWTGPDSQVIPLRRTDQALLQLIDEAQRSLHVVSFAVYKVEAIAEALVKAAGRGVKIAIYLETPDASEGKVAFDTIQALGDQVARQAKIYVWPLEKRPLAAGGRHGSLHAKIALADGRSMLVSSANLTQYAMTLNMEMGVIIRGGSLPRDVARHGFIRIDPAVPFPLDDRPPLAFRLASPRSATAAPDKTWPACSRLITQALSAAKPLTFDQLIAAVHHSAKAQATPPALNPMHIAHDLLNLAAAGVVQVLQPDQFP